LYIEAHRGDRRGANHGRAFEAVHAVEGLGELECVTEVDEDHVTADGEELVREAHCVPRLLSHMKVLGSALTRQRSETSHANTDDHAAPSEFVTQA
jgi:hypothetical protein